MKWHLYSKEVPATDGIYLVQTIFGSGLKCYDCFVWSNEKHSFYRYDFYNDCEDLLGPDEIKYWCYIEAPK